MEENQTVPVVESPPPVSAEDPSSTQTGGTETTGTTTTTVESSDDALVQLIQSHIDFQVSGFNILLGLLIGYIAARGAFDPWK